MKLEIELGDEAKAEMAEAYDWYQDYDVPCGAEFIAEVEDYLELIARQPRMHAVVFRDVRKALVKNYPYCIYYHLEVNRIVVISVFHTSRDPAIWQSRR